MNNPAAPQDIVSRKKPTRSKTLGAAVLLPALSLIPGVKDVVAAHPTESVTALSLLFGALRLATSGKISLGGTF